MIFGFIRPDRFPIGRWRQKKIRPSPRGTNSSCRCLVRWRGICRRHGCRTKERTKATTLLQYLIVLPYVPTWLNDEKGRSMEGDGVYVHSAPAEREAGQQLATVHESTPHRTPLAGKQQRPGRYTFTCSFTCPVGSDKKLSVLYLLQWFTEVIYVWEERRWSMLKKRRRK